jgi:hypothetical protein
MARQWPAGAVIAKTLGVNKGNALPDAGRQGLTSKPHLENLTVDSHA